MLELTARMSGRTTWTLLDEHDRVLDGAEHSNLILNAGLDAFMVGNSTTFWSGSNYPYPLFGQFRRYLALGTGSTAPAVTQTTLAAEVARTDSGGGFDGGSGEIRSAFSSTVNSMSVHATHVRVHTFSSPYNITEYGLSASSGANGALSIRELFRDGGGTPVAISVQAGQKIKVTHTLTVTLPLGFQDVTQPVTNLGNLSAKQSFYRVNDTNVADFWSYVFNPTSGGILYPQMVADGFNAAVAPGSRSAAGTITVQPYTNGTYSRVKRCVLDVADGNGNLYGIAISSNTVDGYTGWRMGFTNPAPLVKDNTKKLTLDVVQSIARG
ncbi:hypothetical protein [Deinococcus xianganensis]|uniref:Uncharacterized protein n=1 Tax=Deinococcus xianganensis TaxID=1507289 RepID=A0A6I4YF60_9DEIO|nr:hypothetical protein [Deinococcus xianganensis]MXV18596.1 hypothetical protein [Deinococcus xianganensis]